MPDPWIKIKTQKLFHLIGAELWKGCWVTDDSHGFNSSTDFFFFLSKLFQEAEEMSKDAAEGWKEHGRSEEWHRELPEAGL